MWYKSGRVIMGISIIMIGLNCAKPISWEEKLFKTSTNDLNKLLLISKVLSINIDNYREVKKEETNNFIKYRIIKKEKEIAPKYREKIKRKWLIVRSNLQKIIQQTPNGKWADDSMFSLALGDMMIAEFENTEVYIKKAIKTIQKFINDYSEWKIEKLTKKILQRSYFNNLKEWKKMNIKMGFSSTISDEKETEAFFQSVIGMQMMKIKEYKKAIKEYNKVIEKYPTSIFAGQAKMQIEVCKELIIGGD